MSRSARADAAMMNRQKAGQAILRWCRLFIASRSPSLRKILPELKIPFNPGNPGGTVLSEVNLWYDCRERSECDRYGV